MKNKIHSLNNAFNEGKRKAKDTKKKLILSNIRKEISRKSGISFKCLISKYTDKQRYRKGLYHYPTTNKAICEALIIPTEAGCRYKRLLEKKQQLTTSESKANCPITNNLAYILFTNPNQIK